MLHDRLRGEQLILVDALIPIKRLQDAKLRLADDLAGGQRRELVLHLLAHEIDVLQRSGVIRQVAVVSPDLEVLRAAEQLGAVGIEQTNEGLNPAIVLGRERLTELEAEAMLIVLGDLPLLSVEDVQAVIEVLKPGKVVLAPDRRDLGTNAMALHLRDGLQFAFGVNSLERHQRAAERAGLDVGLIRRAGLAFDLDIPADLRDYDRMLTGGKERAPRAES